MGDDHRARPGIHQSGVRSHAAPATDQDALDGPSDREMLDHDFESNLTRARQLRRHFPLEPGLDPLPQQILHEGVAFRRVRRSRDLVVRNGLGDGVGANAVFPLDRGVRGEPHGHPRKLHR
jgi:hypothetical protein